MKIRCISSLMIIFLLIVLPVSAQEKAKPYWAKPGMTAEEAKNVQKTAAEYFGLPLNMSLKLNEKVNIELVLIPPGEFNMGSYLSKEETGKLYGREPKSFDLEHPRHFVTISKPFYIGKYELTQQQWNTIIKDNPSPLKGDLLPVEMLSWDQAVEFCKTVSAKTGETVRLLTEAEWEFACRAGTETRFFFGNKVTDKQVNVNTEHAKEAGSYPPNAWGVFEMHGNINEWVNDSYGFYSPEPETDPAGGTHIIGRMLRGGGYSFKHARSCRSAFRYAHHMAMGDQESGFRIAMPARVVMDK